MPEPISLDEAKEQLRVDGDNEDELIQGYIVSAREWVEGETGMILVRREVSEGFRTFGSRMRLKAWPVDPASPVVVSFHDRGGMPQTISDAAIRSAIRPAELAPPAGGRWPSAPAVAGAVVATFVAGYATPDQVPQLLKQAMQGLIVSLYDDRGGAAFKSAEATARSLCRDFRRRLL